MGATLRFLYVVSHLVVPTRHHAKPYDGFQGNATARARLVRSGICEGGHIMDKQIQIINQPNPHIMHGRSRRDTPAIGYVYVPLLGVYDASFHLKQAVAPAKTPDFNMATVQFSSFHRCFIVSLVKFCVIQPANPGAAVMSSSCMRSMAVLDRQHWEAS
jgi:hypothetical protein